MNNTMPNMSQQNSNTKYTASITLQTKRIPNDLGLPPQKQSIAFIRKINPITVTLPAKSIEIHARVDSDVSLSSLAAQEVNDASLTI